MIRRRTRLAASWSAAMALASIVLLAHADDVVSAESFFKEGATAYERGDNRAAALAFEEADRRAPRGAAILNAATAWDGANEPTRAADDFALAANRSDLDGEQRALARARLAVLDRQLGRISIDGPATARVTVAHVTNVALPVVVHVKAGKHTVRVQLADGSIETHEASVDAGGIVSVDIAMPVDASPKQPEVHARGTGWTLGWVSLGVGALASGAALLLGSRALAARDEYDRSGFTDADARDRASRLRTATNVTWIGAGVFGAAGGVLLLTSASTSDRRTASSAHLTLTPFGLQLSAVF